LKWSAILRLMRVLATVFTMVLAVSLASLILVAAPQTPTQRTPAKVEFEVASVRPSGPAPPGRPGRGGQAQGGPGTSDPERLTYERALFRRLLMDAYGVQADQIKGPAWATGNLPDGGAAFDIRRKFHGAQRRNRWQSCCKTC